MNKGFIGEDLYIPVKFVDATGAPVPSRTTAQILVDLSLGKDTSYDSLTATTHFVLIPLVRGKYNLKVLGIKIPRGGENFQIAIRDDFCTPLFIENDYSGHIDFKFKEGSVFYDAIGGSSGIAHPLGERKTPSNNFSDLVTIKDGSRIKKIILLSDAGAGGVLDNTIVEGLVGQGAGFPKTKLDISNDSLDTLRTTLKNLEIEGVQGGDGSYRVFLDCFFRGDTVILSRDWFRNCLFDYSGEISGDNSGENRFFESYFRDITFSDAGMLKANSRFDDCRGKLTFNFTVSGIPVFTVNNFNGDLNFLDLDGGLGQVIVNGGNGKLVNNTPDGDVVVNGGNWDISGTGKTIQNPTRKFLTDAVFYKSTGTPGTFYPIGERRKPGNAFINLSTIKNAENIKKIIMLDDSSGGGGNLDDTIVEGLTGTGLAKPKTKLDISSGSLTTNRATLKNLEIVGVQGGAGIERTLIDCLFNSNGIIVSGDEFEKCFFNYSGNIDSVGGATKQLKFLLCKFFDISFIEDDQLIFNSRFDHCIGKINFNFTAGAAPLFSMNNHSGELIFTNVNGSVGGVVVNGGGGYLLNNSPAGNVTVNGGDWFVDPAGTGTTIKNTIGDATLANQVTILGAMALNATVAKEATALTRILYVDFMKRQILTRTAKGNPATYEAGTAGNKVTVTATYVTISDVEKIDDEAVA